MKYSGITHQSLLVKTLPFEVSIKSREPLQKILFHSAKQVCVKADWVSIYIVTCGTFNCGLQFISTLLDYDCSHPSILDITVMLDQAIDALTIVSTVFCSDNIVSAVFCPDNCQYSILFLTNCTTLAVHITYNNSN